MRLYLQDNTTVVTSHRDEVLLWDGKAFEWARQKPSNLGYDENQLNIDPFEQINQYWEGLPPTKQDEIYAVYKELYNVFEDSSSFDNMIYGLRPVVQKLLDLHPHNEISYWVRIKSTIRISKSKVYNTMEENMKANEQFAGREWPRESAYLEDDYWGLVTLVMTLRTMYPVWGQFMARSREYVEPNMKEFWAMKVLFKTTLETSDAFKHLMGYIKHFVNPGERMDKGVIAGYVATEDFVPWVAGQTLIRRLSLVNFSGRNEKFSLVSSVWSFVANLLRTFDKTVSETIKDKTPEGGGRDNDKDNRSSNLELIKIKEPITSGAAVELNEYCTGEDNTRKIAAMLAPDMPEQILQGGIASAMKLRKYIVHPPQIQLLQLIVSREVEGDPVELGMEQFEWETVFPPRGVNYLEKEQLLSLMAAACAALWWRGHHDLAALLTAASQPQGDVAQGGSAENPTSLSKDYREQLLTLYPHERRPGGKQAFDPNRTKKTCDAIEAIDRLREKFVEHNWVLTLPAPWVEAIPNHNSTSRRFAVRADIRNKIAALSIAIATRSF